MERFVNTSYSMVGNKKIFTNMETVEIIEQIKQEHIHREKLEELNLSASKRILLYGPKGTGKTYIAHHLAKEICDEKVLYIDCNRIVKDNDIKYDFYRDVFYENMKEAFRNAYKTNCAIHIDKPYEVTRTQNITESKSVELLSRCIEHYDGRLLIIEEIDQLNVKSSNDIIDAVIMTDYLNCENIELMIKHYFESNNVITNSLSYDFTLEMNEDLFTHNNIINVCKNAYKNAIINNNSIVDIEHIKIAMKHEKWKIYIANKANVIVGTAPIPATQQFDTPHVIDFQIISLDGEEI